ncbi:unnamed protein product [Vitrella brassicaformis CCMP3155]|uniref:Uncharacterized protein n=1 Tax=Vitrella brassicaformis (strain CCMP3155) TaxID=1169540 RepID=A0A0G4GQE4_VITBC|nr:unnamed protein product [Vitrella brassicaformis CCMP3155]|eukprot:CEM32666.1 unnamed protein product [Vitrella brassicaformis CCMP3155]
MQAVALTDYEKAMNVVDALLLADKGNPAGEQLKLKIQHDQAKHIHSKTDRRTHQHKMFAGMFGEKLSLYEHNCDGGESTSEASEFQLLEQDKSLIKLGMGFAFRPVKAAKPQHDTGLPPLSFDECDSKMPLSCGVAFSVGSAGLSEGSPKKRPHRRSAASNHKSAGAAKKLPTLTHASRPSPKGNRTEKIDRTDPLINTVFEHHQ